MPSSPDGIRSSTTTPTAARTFAPLFQVPNPLTNGLSLGAGGTRSDAIAAAPNPQRISASIENLSSVNVLYVKLGPSCSSTDFHKVLSVAGGVGAGSGESWLIPVGYSGEISIAGTSPLYSYVETTR